MVSLLLFSFSLFAASASAGEIRPERRRPETAKPPDVEEAERLFLPHIEEQIRSTSGDWRSLVARVPYLTETVAMFYAMEDPDVPMQPKLTIAAALLYVVSPLDIVPDTVPLLGQADDAAVVLAALNSVYEHITEGHLLLARDWLVAHGVSPRPLLALGKDFSSPPSEPSLSDLPPSSRPRPRSVRL